MATWVEHAVMTWADRFDTDAPWRDQRQKPWTGDVRALLKMAMEDTIERAAQLLREHPGTVSAVGEAWAREVKKLMTVDEGRLP